MIEKLKWIFTVSILCWSQVDVDGHQLILSDNSPVITGSTVTINATVVDNEGSCVKGYLTFIYEDDAFPNHKYEIKAEKCEALFNVSFGTSIGPSIYRYQVDVLQELIPLINRPIASGRGHITISENLNGQLQLFQNGTNISKNGPQSIYVSSSLETVHKIQLNDADLNYLNNHSYAIAVYWFVDCIYQGNTTNFTFSSNFSQPNTQHEVLGIVVASLPLPITTTTKPISTSTSTASPNITDPTTINNNTTVTLDTSLITTTATPTKYSKSDVGISNHLITSTYTSDCKAKKPDDLLMSAVQLKNQQKYGYFSQSFIVKDPVTNVKVTHGKVWIPEGETVNLLVACSGSGPFRFCVNRKEGPYNVTGNETCKRETNLVECSLSFLHYFRKPTNYTLVFIVSNDVTKVVTPIGINVYKVNKQPQVSVIVVPVTFSSIAIIIVVFGIAYYFQNKSRYMVEVADFDFANNSDMECKTFKERLRDAISQAINRTQDYSEYDGSEEHVSRMVTPQNQKYGSMQ